MVASTHIPLSKPRLRGVLHQWAFFVSLVLGLILVLVASGGRETLAAAIYAASVAGLLGTSATYHRVNWSRQRAYRWMRRLDHAMIFVLIAGTYTPFALLVARGRDGHGGSSSPVWSGPSPGSSSSLAWVGTRHSWLFGDRLRRARLGRARGVPGAIAVSRASPRCLRRRGDLLTPWAPSSTPCAAPTPPDPVFRIH
jgi:hypothetical protein